MYRRMSIEPIDYLMIGHITRDETPDGPRLGGTATFSSLMAKALGLRVGIVTSWGADLPLGPLSEIPIVKGLMQKIYDSNSSLIVIGRSFLSGILAPFAGHSILLIFRKK